jgi:Domain of unknown function (DUF4365)
MDSATRKRRTRAHIIEDLSLNHVAYFVLKNGHVVDKPGHDYGCDYYLTFYSKKTGAIQEGTVYLQLKATDNIRLDKSKQNVLFSIDTRDLHWWMNDPSPWILIVYDAKAEAAYWSYVQASFSNNLRWEKQQSATIKIPVKNKLTLQSIEQFAVFNERIIRQIKKTGITHEISG